MCTLYAELCYTLGNDSKKENGSLSADLVLHRTNEAALQVPTDIGDIERYAAIFAKSGYFQDAQQMAQAAVKIIAGAECGIRPFAAMNGIYIVKGRTSMSANLLATLVKSSRKYDYKIVEITTEKCHIDFYENGELAGSSIFTRADAAKAGTQNLDKYARNMLFARAMSNGVRWFCPDATAGPIYTPEELGEEVDGDGELVRKPRPVVVAQIEAATPQPTKEQMRQDFEARLRSLRYSGETPKLLSAISKKDKPNVGDMRYALELDEDAFMAALAEAGIQPDPADEGDEEDEDLVLQVDTGTEPDPFADEAPINSAQTIGAMQR